MVNASPRDYLFVREITRVQAWTGSSASSRTTWMMLSHSRARASSAGSSGYRLSREEDLDYYPQWLSRYLGESGADNIAIISLYHPNPTRNEGLDG